MYLWHNMTYHDVTWHNMLRRNMTHLWRNMIECRFRSIARKREELTIVPTFCVEKCIRFPLGSPFRVLWVETFFRSWSLRTLHKKMKFFIKDFFNKCDQIRRKLRIWSHFLKKSLMENPFVVQWQMRLALISSRGSSNSSII